MALREENLYRDAAEIEVIGERIGVRIVRSGCCSGIFGAGGVGSFGLRGGTGGLQDYRGEKCY